MSPKKSNKDKIRKGTRGAPTIAERIAKGQTVEDNPRKARIRKNQDNFQAKVKFFRFPSPHFTRMFFSRLICIRD